MNGFYIILLFLCCYGNDAFGIYDYYDTYKDPSSQFKIKRNSSTATVVPVTTTISSTVTSITPTSVSTIFDEEWMVILIIGLSILAVCGAIICCYCCFVKYKKKRKVKVKLKRISETINKNRIINDKKISDLSSARTNYARESSVCYERISTKTDIRLTDEIYEVPNTASSVTSMSALVRSDTPTYNNLDKEPIYRNTSSNGKPLAPPRLQKFLTEEKKDTSFYEHMNGVNRDGDVYNTPKQNSTEIDDPDIYLPLKGDDDDIYNTPKQSACEIDAPEVYLTLKG